MRFQYRLTAREEKESQRQMLGTPSSRWNPYLFCLICMLPSLLISLIIDASFTMIFFLAMIGVLAISAVSSLIARSGKSESYEQAADFTQDHFIHHFSHSLSQTKWGLFDDIQEQAHYFCFHRIHRRILVPKRVLGNEIENCRQFFARVSQIPLADIPSVPLYSQMFESQSPFPVVSFAYHQDDLMLARKTSFRLASQPHTPPASVGSRIGGWVLLVLMVAFLLMFGSSLLDRRDPVYLILLVVAWVLPAVCVLTGVRWVRHWMHRKKVNVPTDRIHLRLTQSGWACGNEDGTTLFDWRDVEDIFVSEPFFGFKTVNQVLNLIPKRIFAGPTEQNRFLEQATELHRQATAGEQAVTTAIETGNPYQSP